MVPASTELRALDDVHQTQPAAHFRSTLAAGGLLCKRAFSGQSREERGPPKAAAQGGFRGGGFRGAGGGRAPTNSCSDSVCSVAKLPFERKPVLDPRPRRISPPSYYVLLRGVILVITVILFDFIEM